MIAFESLLASAAQEAGIPTPKNPERYRRNRWPQWHLFCCAQLGQPMPYPSTHFDNAKVIARIKPEDAKAISWKFLKRRGFKVGYSK